MNYIVEGVKSTQYFECFKLNLQRGSRRIARVSRVSAVPAPGSCTGDRDSVSQAMLPALAAKETRPP